MKIGFLNGYTIWGGGEKWHFEMAEYCKIAGDDVVIISPKLGELSKRSNAVGVNTEDISIGKHSYYNPFFFIKLFFKIKSLKLDVLVFNSFRDVRACALICKFAGVRKVVLRCGMPIAPKESLSYKLNFKLGLDYFVPISQAVQDEFDINSPSLLDEEKCMPYIANGIDLTDFSYVGETSKNTIVIGNASRLSHQKGIDMLLKSISLIKNDVDFVVKIAGTGEEKENLEKLKESFGLSDIVEFVGHTDDVSSFVKELDIYAFTSRYEGTARSMIEAMACGKPVVAFNTSSMKEVVEDQKSGYLVKAFDEEEFAKKIKVLINEKETRQKFGINGRQRVENLFDKVKNFKKWYDFLSS